MKWMLIFQTLLLISQDHLLLTVRGKTGVENVNSSPGFDFSVSFHSPSDCFFCIDLQNIISLKLVHLHIILLINE